MSQSVYDEIEIEDMEYIEEDLVRGPHYTYPCPCGDKFFITMEDLENGEEIAYCPDHEIQTNQPCLKFFRNSHF